MPRSRVAFSLSSLETETLWYVPRGNTVSFVDCASWTVEDDVEPDSGPVSDDASVVGDDARGFCVGVAARGVLGPGESRS